jgi:hypothetical protein
MRLLVLFCLPLSAVALAACAKTVSTTSFKGGQHEVAQTIANLQSDVTASDEKKICVKDIAASVVAQLGGAKGCEKAIKNQLVEIDNTEASVQSVQLAPGGTSASAHVNSTYAGKKQISTLTLVKEGGKWKISGVVGFPSAPPK